MIINLRNIFFKNREQVYIILISSMLMAFVWSYALLSITTFLLFLFFFLDTKENLKYKWQQVKSNKIVLFFVLYFICQCVGLMYSENLDYGLRRVNISLPILFLPIIIYTEKLNKKSFYKLLNILRIYVIIVFTTFLIIHLFIDEMSIDIFALYVLKEKLGISQFYMVFILIIPLLFTINELIRKKNLLPNIGLLIILLLFVFLLSNKTSILMLVLIFIIKLFFYFKNKSTFFKLSIFVITPILFTLFIYNTDIVRQKFDVIIKSTDFDIEIIKTKNQFTNTKNTLEHRILINHLSVEEILKNLPFGVGTGDYQDVLNEKYEEVHFKLGMSEKFNNHNQYLSEVLKTGILGSVVFVILLLCLFRKAVIKNEYYFIILLLFSIACFFESYLDRQHGVIIFSFIIPLFYVYENQLNE